MVFDGLDQQRTIKGPCGSSVEALSKVSLVMLGALLRAPSGGLGGSRFCGLLQRKFTVSCHVLLDLREEVDLLRGDLTVVADLAVPVSSSRVMDPAGDHDQGALGDLACHMLAEAVEAGHAMPFGLGLVPPLCPRASCHREKRRTPQMRRPPKRQAAMRWWRWANA